MFMMFGSSHGAYERSQRCLEVHQQCREAWKAAGVVETLLQGDRQVLDGHDEAW